MAAPTAVPLPRVRRARVPRRALAAAAAVATLAVAVGAGLTGGGQDAAAPALVGSVAPPFSLEDVRSTGPAVELPAGRPVVVNFFASWCVPCRRELPAFQAVADRAGDRVAFLGIDHQDDRKGGLDLLADTGVRFPSGYDPEGKVARAYGLLGMPSTLFVSPDGVLLEAHTGEMSEAQLVRAVERHFGIAV